MAIGTAALLGGAAISGVSNIIGNIFGKKSQDNANEANLKINQMNNEFNAREAEKAFLRESHYNDKVRAEDRAYNSAQAQVERYRQAGLNPALMMQGQSAGMAQSNGVSSSAASAAQAAPQQGFNPDFSGFSNAVNQFLRNQSELANLDAQTDALQIDNKFKERMLRKQLDYLGEQVRGERYKNDRYSEVIDSQIAKDNSQTQYNQIMTDYQKLVNAKVPEKIAAELSLIRNQADAAHFNSKGAIRDLIDSLEKQFGRLPEYVKSAIIAFMHQK